MKTKTLLVFCLITGMAITRLCAQSYQYKGETEWWTPVVCNGVEIDQLTGSNLYIHQIEHYKAGGLQWINVQVHGEITSSSGEVFQVLEIIKVGHFPQPWMLFWHDNLRGSEGNHYIMFFELNWNDEIPTITCTKAVCPGN